MWHLKETKLVSWHTPPKQNHNAHVLYLHILCFSDRNCISETPTKIKLSERGMRCDRISLHGGPLAVGVIRMLPKPFIPPPSLLRLAICQPEPPFLSDVMNSPFFLTASVAAFIQVGVVETVIHHPQGIRWPFGESGESLFVLT
ncbi:hypothetical protein NPIL_619591 [Nephila pilipes]|uniref:Uncharacterized protein n=1 Tax=Nephila pilipes TaxID=299642 RepID=A0A8X6NV07_NEPPI|nr:hypothetical protein NPIL_619591 [Nephila pilipes]